MLVILEVKNGLHAKQNAVRKVVTLRKAKEALAEADSGTTNQVKIFNLDGSEYVPLVALRIVNRPFVPISFEILGPVKPVEEVPVIEPVTPVVPVEPLELKQEGE